MIGPRYAIPSEDRRAFSRSRGRMLMAALGSREAYLLERALEDWLWAWGNPFHDGGKCRPSWI